MTTPADPGSSQGVRSSYASAVVGRVGAASQALTAAFAAVERERFVGSPPWRIVGAGYGPMVSHDPRDLYQDALVVLAPERGINNGQPSLHARCLAACAPSPGELVVHVGAGCGYYTAILANLVGAGGRVVAYEIENDLARQARANLAGLANVTVVSASATDAVLPEADVVYVNAGATHPPAPWLDALRIGGRLMFPLTANDDVGCMLLVTRTGTARYAARALMRVAFVPCIGARDAASSRELAAALASRSLKAVRSLGRGTPPAEGVWYAGRDWWLSTAPPA